MSEEMTETEEVAFREKLDRELWDDGDTVYLDGADEDQPETQEPEDEWTGVNPTLRQSFETMRLRIGDLDTLHNRLRKAEGKLGEVTQRMHEAALAVKKAEKPTAEQLAQEEKAKREWEELKEGIPEFENALEAYRSDFTRKAAEIEGRIPDVVAMREALKTDFDQQLSTVQKNFEIRLVDRAHRGWRDTVRSSEYAQWLTTQPNEVQAKTQSDSADDAIEVLDSFKDFKTSKKSPDDILRERSRRLESAAADNRQTGRPTKTKSEEDMTDAEYRAYLDKTLFKT